MIILSFSLVHQYAYRQPKVFAYIKAHLRSLPGAKTGDVKFDAIFCQLNLVVVIFDHDSYTFVFEIAACWKSYDLRNDMAIFWEDEARFERSSEDR